MFDVVLELDIIVVRKWSGYGMIHYARKNTMGEIF